jgi:hypothetical protein
MLLIFKKNKKNYFNIFLNKKYLNHYRYYNSKQLQKHKQKIKYI